MAVGNVDRLAGSGRGRASGVRLNCQGGDVWDKISCVNGNSVWGNGRDGSGCRRAEKWCGAALTWCGMGFVECLVGPRQWNGWERVLAEE